MAGRWALALQALTEAQTDPLDAKTALLLLRELVRAAEAAEDPALRTDLALAMRLAVDRLRL